MKWCAVAAGLTISGWLVSGARASEPTPCTLAECVDKALAHGPDLAAKRAAIDGARAQKSMMRGNYGPKLIVGGGVQVWDDEVVADFDVGIPNLTIPPIVVREQVTWQVNVTIAQPLSKLFEIYQANELAAIGIDVAELERDLTEVSRALAVTEAWLQVVLSDDLIAVRKSSLEARSSDRKRAQELVKAGVIVESDLLRAELGVTQARQALALAERQASLAKARLAQLVGSPVVPEESAERPAIKEVVALDEAKRTALERRLELAQLRARIEQAEAGVEVAKAKMAPEVNFVAQAQFARASAFGEETAAFVGLTFDWTVWEWGATYYGIDEANAQVRQARAGLTQLEEGIALEVEAAWVEHASAVDQAALAKEAVRVAADNYDSVRKRFEHQAATSFDLVEAETSLTKARSDERLALVNGYLARARLARAMGMNAEEIAREGAP